MESLGRLGIDLSSLLLYAVNFGVIVLLLAKFFTKPVLEMMEKRKKVIATNVHEAEELKEELIKQRELMKKEKEELKAQVEEEMKKMHQEIDQRRRDAETEIDTRKAKMLEDVQKVMNEEKANLQMSVQKEMMALVEKMVLHIVHNKVSNDVVAESTEEAWKLYTR